MADHNKPTLTSTYANFVTEVDGRLDDLAKGYDPAKTTVTNPQTDAIRWNSASSKWQIFNGTTWGDLSASYAINAATASALATARSIGMTGDVTWSIASFNGGANVTAAATLATVNSNVGAFGSATAIPVVTVNGKGLVTAVSTAAITTGTAIQKAASGGLTAATASDIVTAIGATAVTNATNATNATTAAACSGNAATATMAKSVPVSTTTGTLVAADAGKTVTLSAGITIANATHAAGDAITLYNNTAGNLTITQGASFTLRQVGTANTGNRTLAQRGLVTIWFLSGSEGIISGGGLT
jgi:hypothetical protein